MNTKGMSTLLPCGCSKQQALDGHCQTYDQEGARRAEPEIYPMCRSNIRRLAAHFDRRHDDVQQRADELRSHDASSYAEHQCIADTFTEAAASVWDLLGGRIQEELPASLT